MPTRLKTVQEVNRLVVTVITDNYYDALRPGTKVSTPFHSKPGSIIHAEHGLSYHVETVVNAQNGLIDRYIEDIKGFAPDYIVPAHCTGFEAVMRFAREMPEQFILNTAGTSYTFAA
jgi:metal-dependent hydrolase (beta-lactamase superfamily II)